MTFNPTITQADIDSQVAKINCCSANLVYSLVANDEQGVENCVCSYKELQYLIGSQETLQSYTAIGVLLSNGTKYSHTYDLANDGTLSQVTVTTSDGDTLFDGGATTYGSISNMITAIISVISGGWTGTHPSSNQIVLTSPYGDFSATTVTISFFGTGGGKIEHYPGLMTGGTPPTYQTAAMNCLTTLQVERIIEGTTKICGCSDCVQNRDAAPQAGAVIVRVSSNGWWEYPSVAGMIQLSQAPLVNKIIDNVFVDNSGRLTLTQYSFDAPTGVITFSWDLTAGQEISVAYH